MEHILLIKASKDFLVCKEELSISNNQITNLQSQIEYYKLKEANWEELKLNWDSQKDGYEDQLSNLNETIRQQKKVITKAKITSWAAPVGVTVVLSSVVLPLLLSK